ncbi:sensor histidine kinase [uncultured Cellulomonas sp.]|uniref:sensor histidine kinase n=1 Tax=uncultured Cellulomonas sp. TaxID=189682 RepID=UPI00262216D6|nr:histidine kinase dimerization/phosphoacceptor domain-containing protein [uncultured Cellulomonas sp.]
MSAGVAFRDDTLTAPEPGIVLFTVLAWLPLLARTAYPLPVLVVTALAEIAQLVLLPVVSPDWQGVDPFAAFQPVPVATVTAAFTAAVRCSRRQAWIVGGGAAAAIPAAAMLTVGSELKTYAFPILVMANLVVTGTGTGAAIAARRKRAGREAADRLERTRRAVEEERLRIARDLHDVVAHHLTLVDAQVSVAGYLVRQDPALAATALDNLTRHTRLALDELRATVGLLRGRTEEEPATRPPTPASTTYPGWWRTLAQPAPTPSWSSEAAPMVSPPELTSRGTASSRRL